ncbi:MAG: hypothetical protein ACPG5O_04105 [Pseudoalteromonas tetraodonis]
MPTKYVFTYNLQAPFEGLDALVSEFSYGITLPPTKNNLEALGNPNIILNRNINYDEHEASMFLNKNLFRRGAIKILNTNGKGLKVSFTASANNLFGRLGNLMMSELNMGETILPKEDRRHLKLSLYTFGPGLTETLTLQYLDEDYPQRIIDGDTGADLYHTASYSYTMPTPGNSGPDQWDALQHFTNLINADDKPYYAEYNRPETYMYVYHKFYQPKNLHNEFYVGAGATTPGTFEISDSWLMEDIPDFPDDNEEIPILKHAKVQSEDPDADYVFPTVLNTMPTASYDGAVYNQLLNAYNYDRYYYYTGANMNYLVPMFRLKGVLRLIFLAQGYELSGDVITKDWFREIIITNNKSLWIESLWKERQPGDWAAPLQINPTQHMPNVPFKKFIKDLMYMFGLVMVVDDIQKQVEVLDINEVLQVNKTIDISRRTSNDYNVKPVETNLGYELKMSNPSFSNDNEKISTLDGAKIMATYENYSDIPTGLDSVYSDGQIVYVTNENLSYSATRGVSEVEWTEYKTIIDSHSIDGGGKKIQLSGVATHMQRYTLPYFLDEPILLTPVINETITHVTDANIDNETDFKTEDGEFDCDLRFLVYLGMQEGGHDTMGLPGGSTDKQTYPLASTTVYSYDRSVVGENSAIMSSDYGRFNRRLKKWFSFNSEAAHISSMYMPSMEDILFLNIQTKLKYRGFNLLYTKIALKITEQGFLPSALKARLL